MTLTLVLLHLVRKSSQTRAHAALSDQKSLQNERCVQCTERNVLGSAISTKYCAKGKESSQLLTRNSIFKKYPKNMLSIELAKI